MGAGGDVDRYVSEAPDAIRPEVERIRALIRAEAPDLVEQMGPNGFCIYTRDDEWRCGFAHRTKGPMLYVMAQGVLDKHDDTLGRLRSGKSCVEWRASKTLTLDELHDLARIMIREAAR